MRFVNISSYFNYNSSKRWGYETVTRGGDMKPLKEKISITIDSDVLEKIKIQAENDDRSLSQYINLILKEHLKKESGERQ